MATDAISKKTYYGVNEEKFEKFAFALSEKMAPYLDGERVIGRFRLKDLTRYIIYDRVPSHLIGLGQILKGAEVEAQFALHPEFFRIAVIMDLHRGSLDMGLGSDFVGHLQQTFAETYAPLLKQYNIPAGSATPIFRQVRRDSGFDNNAK
ncbi:MAG: hypothetical protein KGH65_00640 [Candidatus Micrarchaeota archaeon]|nr:hypothetical protein [Candidatus Micrarchaeota archaeon]